MTGYVIALLLVIFVIFYLLVFLKKESSFSNNPTDCGFKISKPKVKNCGDRKIAYFSVYVKENHKFFVEFPVLFKFYSDYRFKSKIKIGYTIPGDKNKEEIFKDNIEFIGKTKEYVYYLTDIILGRIDIEIEAESEYGNPIISFEILENVVCKLKKEYVVEIKF
jgi:hypothetical protein